MNDTIVKFGYPDTLVHDYHNWLVLLRPQQVTLGSLVLACKEPVKQFHEVSADGFGELKTVISDIEHALSAMVSYRRINYLMLMMVDPDVHFHVIPRYPDPLEFDGRSFADAGWPGPPALAEPTDTDAALNAAIITRLKRHWPVPGVNL
ncbi:MAG: HIT family protein [Pseudomonadales bacterium]